MIYTRKRRIRKDRISGSAANRLRRMRGQSANSALRHPTTLISAKEPLVSCVMPTADRRQWVPQAIRNFQQQNYPNRELLIVDDGREAV